MLDALTKLIKVKTIVTLVLTGVFAFLCCTEQIDSDKFITVFTVVISFYFGTQFERSNPTTSIITNTTNAVEGGNSES